MRQRKINNINNCRQTLAAVILAGLVGSAVQANTAEDNTAKIIEDACSSMLDSQCDQLKEQETNRPTFGRFGAYIPVSGDLDLSKLADEIPIAKDYMRYASWAAFPDEVFEKFWEDLKLTLKPGEEEAWNAAKEAARTQPDFYDGESCLARGNLPAVTLKNGTVCEPEPEVPTPTAPETPAVAPQPESETPAQPAEPQPEQPAVTPTPTVPETPAVAPQPESETPAQPAEPQPEQPAVTPTSTVPETPAVAPQPEPEIPAQPAEPQPEQPVASQPEQPAAGGEMPSQPSTPASSNPTNSNQNSGNPTASPAPNPAPAPIVVIAPSQSPLLNGSVGELVLRQLQSQSRGVFDKIQCTSQRDETVWITLGGKHGKQSANAHTAAFDERSREISVGAETRYNNDHCSRIGVALSHTDSRFNAGSIGNADARTWQLFGYGSYQFDTTVAHGYLGVGKSRIDSRHYFAGTAANADYSGKVWQAGAALSYPIALESGGKFTPRAELNYGALSHSGYRETAGADSIHVAKATTQSLILRGSLRYDAPINDKFAAKLEAGIGTELLKPQTVRFAQAGKAAGALSGKASRLVANLGVGVGYKLTENTRLSLDYNFEHRKGYQSHQGKVGLEMRF